MQVLHTKAEVILVEHEVDDVDPVPAILQGEVRFQTASWHDLHALVEKEAQLDDEAADVAEKYVCFAGAAHLYPKRYEVQC